ncbi:hypothetical protein [Paracidovorax oryzae]|uniref:hypothetical protein n=1 Tax=Paracidovorax oryzae TaxID=862720 RepID=UPI0012EB32BD|nr:hypothetical protein [Paracidovorax oryzae]
MTLHKKIRKKIKADRDKVKNFVFLLIKTSFHGDGLSNGKALGGPLASIFG